MAESAVDPTRSQNSTVSWRRSIGREPRGFGAGAGEPACNRLPQSPQNLLGAGFAAPQARQRRTAAAPHKPQNFLCAGTSAAQFEQCIRTSGGIFVTRLPCAGSRKSHMILVTTPSDPMCPLSFTSRCRCWHRPCRCLPKRDACAGRMEFVPLAPERSVPVGQINLHLASAFASDGRERRCAQVAI